MNEMEAQVLKAMLRKEGWADLSLIVTADAIGNTNVRAVYEVMRRLHGTTSDDLTPDSIALDISVTFNGERQEELLEMVEAIEQTEEVPLEALNQSARKWISRELQAKAAKYVGQNLASPELDPAHGLALFQRAVDIMESPGGQVVGLAETGLPGQTVDRPGLTPLGLSDKLDDCLGGGVAAGELAIVLAPPARGKTSYLCAIGAAAAKRGQHVLHITLEISTARVGRRYDSCLTGMKASQMILNPHSVAAARKAMAGEVYIKDWSYHSTSPSDIRGLVKGMRAHGKKVDLIIVDYLELLEPDSGQQFNRREQRHVYGALGKQMRAAAVALNVPIVTAWQVNREGSDLHNVELKHVSESWDIIKHADQILSLNQSEQEQAEKIMRIRVLKQRDNTDRPMIYLNSDLDRMKIREAGSGGPVDVQTLGDQ
jgi:replicative DNA helicase